MAKLPCGVIFTMESADKGTTINLKYLRELVFCKDCTLKECEGRNGMIVCDITGESHRPDWFCADGERNEENGNTRTSQTSDFHVE